MHTNRRDFLRYGSLAAIGLSLPSLRDRLFPSWQEEAGKPWHTFGIQLWTIREDLAKDPKGVLAQLASYGYKQIESFEGPQGIFWGMKNTEFKKYMDDLGMTLVSAHCNHLQDFERKAAEAAEIGVSHLICPYKGAQKSIDKFKMFADEFNKAGETCRKAGIRFAYHNHDYSFKSVDGQIPQDVMMQGTDKDLVDFELDIYWIVLAGQDPKAWFKKYPNRFRLCHVKDRAVTAAGPESCIIGKGDIDFADILKTSTKYGMKTFIVEQESYTSTTPMDSSKANAQYMHTL
jgi:sugar phosphate isomerase/epimerase